MQVSEKNLKDNEMKKIEQVFEETDQVLSAILNATPIGFILASAQGQIKHFNKESEHLFVV